MPSEWYVTQVDVCWGRRRQRTLSQRVGRVRKQAGRVCKLPAGAAFRTQVAAGPTVAALAWGAAVDNMAPTTARELRNLVHRALMRGVGSRQAVEADLAFHGSSRRLDPMEAAVPEAMAQWVGRPATGPAAW